MESCTLVANQAINGAGVLHAGPGTYRSSVFFGNMDASGTGQDAQLRAGGAGVLAGALNYCTVQGWTGSYGGVGNDGQDPAFVNQAAGDLHLSLLSPLLELGDPTLFPGQLHVDFDGEPRLDLPAVLDRGADQLWDCNGDGTIDVLGPGSDCNDSGLLDQCDLLNGTSVDLDGNGIPDECLALSSPVLEVSAATGDLVPLSLDSGPSSAGRIYLVLGTTAGTSPGIPIDGVPVPLNLSGYTLLTFNSLNQGLFQQTFGVLSVLGTGSAQILVLPGIASGLVGATLHHAYLEIDLTLGGVVAQASNPLTLTLLP